jgi:hypothetical protein
MTLVNKYFHDFIIRFKDKYKYKYFKIRFAIYQYFMKILGENVYTTVINAPILSNELLKRSLKNKNHLQNKYSFLSCPAGDMHTEQQPLQTYLHRSFGPCKFRLSYSEFFDQGIRRLIKIPVKKLIISEPVYALPYYNTQFGHFTGELLGLIFYYLDLINPSHNRKLLIPNAGHYIDSLISQLSESYFIRIDSAVFLTTEVYLKDVIILPIVHPYQNLSFLKQKLSTTFPYIKPEFSGRVFVTSNRKERISNIEEVISVLKENKFEILSGRNFSNLENSKIKFAEILLIEDGSLSHLAIMHRDKKYYKLSSAIFNEYSPLEYFGGCVFTEFDTYYCENIMCNFTPYAKKHILTFQLHVDIQHMLKTILGH